MLFGHNKKGETMANLSPLFIVNSTLTLCIVLLSFLNYKKNKIKIFLYLFIFFTMSGFAYCFDYLNWGKFFNLLSVVFKVVGYLLIIQFLHAQLISLNNNNNLPK